MKAFLGLLLHMGVVNLPNLQDYWSRDPFLQSNGIWKHVMSRDRFLLLLRFWHFEDEINPESRLQKISPLIDHLNNTMSKVYRPDENLSLKNDRHKYGVKLYELWLRANWCNSNESANRTLLTKLTSVALYVQIVKAILRQKPRRNCKKAKWSGGELEQCQYVNGKIVEMF